MSLARHRCPALSTLPMQVDLRIDASDTAVRTTLRCAAHLDRAQKTTRMLGPDSALGGWGVLQETRCRVHDPAMFAQCCFAQGFPYSERARLRGEGAAMELESVRVVPRLLLVVEVMEVRSALMRRRTRRHTGVSHPDWRNRLECEASAC